MKTLYLLRHAKSSWDDPGLADFDRPLNERGEMTAPFMGEVARRYAFIPDVILSSPAKRARETALLARDSGGFKSEILYDERIYEASPQMLRQTAASVHDEFQSLMLVGHNPGMEGFIRYLTGKLESMPTAALAVIDLDIDSWDEIDANTGTLRKIIRPKEEMKVFKKGG